MRLQATPRFGYGYTTTFAKADVGVVRPGSVIKVPGTPDTSGGLITGQSQPDRYYYVPNWDRRKMLLAPLQTPEQAGLDPNTEFTVVASGRSY